MELFVDTQEAKETPPDEAAKDQPKSGQEAPEGAAGTAQERSTRASLGQIEDLVAAVRRLETFASEEAKRVSGKLVPQIESKAKQNIWVSLLVALGLGLILGVWLTGGRRRD